MTADERAAEIVDNGEFYVPVCDEVVLKSLIAAAIREAEAEVWQNCLKALCPYCAEEYPGTYHDGRWIHRAPDGVEKPCPAGPIQEMGGRR